MACAAPGPPMTLFSCRCSVKRLRSFVSEHTCDMVAFKRKPCFDRTAKVGDYFAPFERVQNQAQKPAFVKEKLLAVCFPEPNLSKEKSLRFDYWRDNLHIYVCLATKIYADIMTPQAVFSIDLTCTKKIIYIQHRFNMANMRCG